VPTTRVDDVVVADPAPVPIDPPARTTDDNTSCVERLIVPCAQLVSMSRKRGVEARD
jgi:hypothetical protein